MIQFLEMLALIIICKVAIIAVIVITLNTCFIFLKNEEKYTDLQRFKFVSWIMSWATPLLIFSKVEIEGYEIINQVEKGIIYANHPSIFDVFALLKKVKRPHTYIAKAELGRMFFLRRGMPLLKCSLLDDNNPRSAVKTVNEAVKNVKEGLLTVIFPEGERLINAPIGMFKAGSFKVALKSKADIIPLTIYNTHLVKKRWPRPTPIKIKVHEPIPHEIYKDMETPVIAKMVEKIVKQDLLL